MTSKIVLVNGQSGSECDASISPLTDSIPRQTRTLHPTETGRECVVALDIGEDEEDTPVGQIERDLDELTFSGSAINDLEVQLTRTRDLYRQTLLEGRVRVDDMRKKLRSHIIKSEPFVGMWRKAKQVQEMSNKAAARYDKANSQHAAAKEMIRVAESQLAACREEQLTAEDPSSTSPLDAAWQEMLNHATSKVVLTEKERRDSEIEHRKVLNDCTTIMMQYQTTERKLHSHIVKSRPYYEERYKVNQYLTRLKAVMKDLEKKISESKQKYAASLKRLDLLNTEMHQRRGTLDSMLHSKSTLDTRRVVSTGNTPEMRRSSGRTNLASHGGHSMDDHSMNDAVSMDSLQMCELGVQFSGSVGSLASLHTEQSSTPQERHDNKSELKHSSSGLSSSSSSSSCPSASPYSCTPPHVPSPPPHVPSPPPANGSSTDYYSVAENSQSDVDQGSSSRTVECSHEDLEKAASQLVLQCLDAALGLTSDASNHH